MAEAIRKDSSIRWTPTETFCTCAPFKATLEGTELIYHCRTMWKSRALGLNNMSNEPPRGEVRDSPNDDPSCLCRKFLRIQYWHVVNYLVWVQGKTLKGFHGFALGEGARIQVGVEGSPCMEVCWIVGPPASTPSAASGRWQASSLSLTPRVRCSSLLVVEQPPALLL